MEILKEIKENWKYLLLSVVIALFYISLFNAQAGAADLNVSLSYREMIALAPDTEVRLMLVDPTETEENLIIKDLNKKLTDGVPVKFNLNLSKEEIDQEKDYQLFGIIKAERDMIWTESQLIKGKKLLQEKNLHLITKRSPARLLSFKGEKDLKIRFLNGIAQVITDTEEYILPQQRTASGAKFANSNFSVWNKGRQLLIREKGQDYKAELISLADIKENTEIQARGEEPYWELNLNQNSLELKYDYLTNKIRIPMANVEKIKKNNSVVYQVQTSFLNFEIKLLENIHYNAMNGRIYPLTAFVKINDQKFIGGADLLID